MRELRYLLADVFTDRVFGGNPLAVFPAADGLDDATMQRIAAELNLSESVFVTRAIEARAAARLRIFTPRMELPFAGHPTVGAACMLAEEGALGPGECVFEELVGPVRVAISSAAGVRTATLTVARLPEEGPAPPDRAALARMLSIDAGDIVNAPRGPALLSCGVPFAIIPVLDVAVLGRVQLNGSVWADVLANAWAPHVYVVARDPDDATCVRARMFAPAMGISEDPATGAAAAALAGYLGRDLADGTHVWHIEQGIEMGRPSRIDIEVDRHQGAFAAVRVGGAAVRVGKGVLHLP